MKGHETFAMLREMARVDCMSVAQLEELRQQRLQEFLGYCYRHVPYVRQRMQEAGLQPTDIRSPEDLVRLPLLRKADVRRNRESLRSDRAGKLAQFTTGGSTGEPLVFDLAKRRVASRVACKLRATEWWGVTVGDPEVALWGAPVEVTRQDWLRSVRDRFLATRLLSAFEMNEATTSRYLDVIESSNWKQIFGYPSALYLLCVQARKEGRNLRRIGIKVAFATGEVLFPHQRELISETLNCPVANGYGGRDSGFIAHECPQGGMHIMADALIVEVIDAQGNRVAPGESGEIVVTDLFSHEAPFVRYATGDTGVMSARRCGCGRVLPLLERIDGRSNDSIVAPDGRIINSLALIYPIRELEGIEHFRICQKSVDRFHVQIVRGDRFRLENEDRIRTGWVKLLRAPLEVTFEYMDTLPLDRSGKLRHVVSEIPPPEMSRDRRGHVGMRPVSL
jgi:phenylacetate-CoA ligase